MARWCQAVTTVGRRRVRFPPEGVGGVGQDGPHEHGSGESCYRAVKSRDRRFDGVFYVAVRTTGIYCRPSCPARTPAYANVTFHPSAAAAQAAGYRACKRCLPDATPGSPDWDVAATAAGRAMRLIADGVVDREGVEGLAHRVGYTPRHLSRLLTAELGAGPLALARARRAQTARVLIETTDLGFADVAFAAGFASVRQFNETVREVYAGSPSDLRGRRGGVASPGAVTMRLAVRTPFAGRAAARLPRPPPGPGRRGRRTRLVRAHARPSARPRHGPARPVRRAGRGGDRVRHRPLRAVRPARHDRGGRARAATRRRRLRPARGRRPVRRRPGDRSAGAGDTRTARARSGGRRRDRDPDRHRPAGERRRCVHGGRPSRRRARSSRSRPTSRGSRTSSPTRRRSPPSTRSRCRCRGPEVARWSALAAALASGEVALDRGPDRDDVRAALLALPGVGPWTADYVAMRALAHPDVFLPTDIGVRNALAGLGLRPRRRWSPTATAGDPGAPTR